MKQSVSKGERVAWAASRCTLDLGCRYTYGMSRIIRGQSEVPTPPLREAERSARQRDESESLVSRAQREVHKEESAETLHIAPIGKPITLRMIAKWMRAGEKFSCLTCYDATTARWLQQAGVPVLLVGDTAAEMILGLPGTIHAPLEFLITLTSAVKRGAPNCLVIADMPFMSYQADDAEGLRNAARFMTEGTADAVKLEVDASFAPLVEKMARAGVPVVAHIGARPQQAKLLGGYGAAGKVAEEAERILADALAMEQAGAVMLLVEACPNEVSERIIQETGGRIPLIGCGGGPACHGQIVVLQDLLGLTIWQPAFAQPVVRLGDTLIAAAQQWIENVRAGRLGEHPYSMSPEERKRFAGDGRS
jgi:3-methyl-2-oxobutanoate hydroxymethyltransferase